MKKAWNYLLQKFHGIWKGHEIIKLCIGPWKCHEIGCYNVFNVYEKAMNLQRWAWGHENTMRLCDNFFKVYFKGPWNYKDELGPWKKHEIIYYKNFMAYEKAMNYKVVHWAVKIPWNCLLLYFQGLWKGHEIAKISVGSQKYHEIICHNFLRFIKVPWNCKDEHGSWINHEIVCYQILMACKKARKAQSCARGHEIVCYNFFIAIFQYQYQESRLPLVLEQKNRKLNDDTWQIEQKLAVSTSISPIKEVTSTNTDRKQ